MTNTLDTEAFAARMRADGLPQIAIDAFERALLFVAGGGQTMIAEADIQPVDKLPALASLSDYEGAGQRALAHAVVIKLNGGLGTGMGLSRAKSLLPVRDGLSFLDLIARQVIWQRQQFDVQLPLVLMNSFRTRDDSLRALAAHPGLRQPLPLDFLQHRVPRVDAASWLPVCWPADPALEWCPPGHGDIYIALASSGMLDELRANGVRYAFVSNADNLGAVIEPRILGWMAERGLPFVMEVAERTAADRKGGHLARRDGQLILRESAQCAPADDAAFQDITRHHFFNTNNLWVDLDALTRELGARAGGLSLPVIRNAKTVVADDPDTPTCYQLETAMGSAIECFAGAAAVAVARERFAPVKATSDLLTLWSDAYRLTNDSRMVPADAALHAQRLIELDARFYGGIDGLQQRFAHGAPSLLNCRHLRVQGDHVFGANVVVEGEVLLENTSSTAVHIADGTRLRG